MRKGSNKIPNHIQVDTVSPATKLLEKRRQMYEVHEAFEAQKEQYKAQEEAFKRQEDVIRQRDLDIQEELIKYCKFLHDNEAKRARAEKRHGEEKAAKDKKQTEINQLNDKLSALQKNSSKLEKKVNALKKYEDYLDSVIKSHQNQYNDLNELLTRHTVLETKNKELTMQHQHLEDQLASLTQESAQFEKEKIDELLKLNNDLANLQQQLDEVDSEKTVIQMKVETSSKDASSKNLNFGRILMAIDNIHQRCEEGVRRIKEDAKKEADKGQQQAQEKKKQEEAKTNKTKDAKEKREAKEEQDDDYNRKAEKAIDKLKKILEMMTDFSDVIKYCESDPNKKNKPK